MSLCQGLYFHIGETEQKCFIEEVPSETMIVGELERSIEDGVMMNVVVGKYKTQLYDDAQQQWLPSSPGIGMHVEVRFKLKHTTTY